MEIIKFNSYSNTEKMVIAREFLLPNVVKNIFNDDSIRVDISDANMMKIVCCGGPSPQDHLVHAGSFVNKRFNKKGIKIGKSNGGVRYIKKILERIVSRINLHDLENAALKKSRTKTQDLEKKPHQKAAFSKKPHKKQKNNILTIDDKIINEIIKNK
jgi:hypothetical protein